MSADQVLITGADGYMGSRIAKRYLDGTDLRLILWMRAGDLNIRQRKQSAMDARLGFPGKRVSYAWGDLENSDPFGEIDSAAISTIIHSAAIIRFNVEEDLANHVNVDGTDKLLRFATRCPNLESFGLLSSVYASGLQSGPIVEERFPGIAGFANHYERSKWASESLLLDGYADLPWKICRLATAIADDEEGRVVQYNAFHNTLKLFYYGLMSLVPGHARTPLYFITGNFASEALFQVMKKGKTHTFYHIAHPRSASITLGGLVDTAFTEFNRDPVFRSRRILPPLYTDAASFDLLTEGVQSFGGGIVQQSVSSVAPFARQLFIDKDIDTVNLRHAWSHACSTPDAETLIRKTCHYLAANRWGRNGIL